MNVSIVIPNYNGSELLEKNLPKVIEAISSYTSGFAEIVVVDDASTDGSIAFLKNYKKQFTEKSVSLEIVESSHTHNMGFAHNVNKGVRHAKGDIVVLLNSDVIPHKDFLEPLIKHFTDEKFFAVGCLDESIEGGKVILRGRGVGSWQRGFLIHRAGDVGRTNTLWVSGGSGAFRKILWQKLGGLNELYIPFYWEDIDLSYRAVKSGYSILFEPMSRVIHEHEKGAIQKNYTNYNKIKIVYRNQFTFVWINITDSTLLLSHILWLPFHLFKAMLRKDKAFFWGFFHACIRLPKIMSYKAKAKKLFTKKDKEVIALSADEHI